MEYYCFDENRTSETFASKSIPAAKFQNSADISGAQKPTWAKFLEFDFFYLKRQGYIQNSPWGQFIFLHKSFNKIVD